MRFRTREVGVVFAVLMCVVYTCDVLASCMARAGEFDIEVLYTFVCRRC